MNFEVCLHVGAFPPLFLAKPIDSRNTSNRAKGTPPCLMCGASVASDVGIGACISSRARLKVLMCPPSLGRGPQPSLCVFPFPRPGGHMSWSEEGWSEEFGSFRRRMVAFSAYPRALQAVCHPSNWLMKHLAATALDRPCGPLPPRSGQG